MFWLILAIACIVVEVTVIRGMGFVFAGLSALTVFLALEMRYIEHGIMHDIIFFILFTGVWGAILWIPMKRFHRVSLTKNLKNIVGSLAEVEDDDLVRGEVGIVEWSNIRFKAMIDKTCEYDRIKEGEDVLVVRTENKILYVTRAD